MSKNGNTIVYNCPKDPDLNENNESILIIKSILL